MASKRAVFKEIAESVFMIGLGVAVFVLTPGLYRTICLGVLALTVLHSCLKSVLRIIANADRLKTLKEENRRLHEQLELKEQLPPVEEKPQHDTPELPELNAETLLANTEIIRETLERLYPGLPLSYKRYFRQVADLSRVDSRLVALNEHVVRPFMESIRQVELPLSEDESRWILRQLLQDAFLMLDLVDTYRYNVNNTPEQLLGLKVACGELSHAEAVESVKTATFMADETPRYLRALKEVVDNLELGGDPFLYSGYKL